MPVILALVMLVSLRAFASETVSGRVIKVLPLFLDTNGVDAISPSLFDRDAYQAELRKHPSRSRRCVSTCGGAPTMPPTNC